MKTILLVKKKACFPADLGLNQSLVYALWPLHMLALFLLLVREKKGEGLEPEDMSRKCMIYWERKRLYRFGFICIVMQAPFLGSEKTYPLS